MDANDRDLLAPIVSALVQHHPSRAHLLPELLERLAPLPVQVVPDPQPHGLYRSAWRSYWACLRAFPDDATHVLIVQDDVTLCRDLPQALPAIVAGAQEFAQGDPLIALSLFHEVTDEQRAVLDSWRFRTRIAPFMKPDVSWLPYYPLVATIWPRAARDALLEVAPDPYMGHGTLPGAVNPPLVRCRDFVFTFLEVTDDNALDASAFPELGRLDIFDDSLVYAHRDFLPPLVGTIPSLASHRTEVSVLNPPARDRRTAMYIGDEASALEVFAVTA